LAAFVGAGGYGQRIAEGLAVKNNEVMLSGATPAAAFAIVMQIMITLCVL
jgi:osmoprotectant transport system permease protein